MFGFVAETSVVYSMRLRTMTFKISDLPNLTLEITLETFPNALTLQRKIKIQTSEIII